LQGVTARWLYVPVGVPDHDRGEELKAYVQLVRAPGEADPSPEEIVEFCAARLAPHKVPRYLEFLSELPLTPTEKVEKYRLREAGVTAGTWDREGVRR